MDFKPRMCDDCGYTKQYIHQNKEHKLTIKHTLCMCARINEFEIEKDKDIPEDKTYLIHDDGGD